MILNPTSSATGAYATLANSSSGVVAGRLPTDTPDEFKSIDSRTVTIRRLELRSGMTTNQSGVDVGFDFLVRAFKLAMNPPRSMAAAQKHAEKIAIRTMMRIKPFAGIMRKDIRANRYTGKTPSSLRRLGPNWVVMIARAVSAKDRA